MPILQEKNFCLHKETRNMSLDEIAEEFASKNDRKRADLVPKTLNRDIFALSSLCSERPAPLLFEP